MSLSKQIAWTAPACDPRRAEMTFLVMEPPDLTAITVGLGEGTARRLADLHERIVRSVIKRHRGRGVSRGSWNQVLFERPDHAVNFAVVYFRSLDRLSQGELTASVGIHYGTERSASGEVAAKLAALAGSGRILLTQEVRDRAGSFSQDSEPVHWLDHGCCEVEGLSEPLEVFEVLV